MTPPREASAARPANTAARLMQHLWPGALVVQTLHTAAALRLADLVASGPRTIDELAAQTGSHAPSLRRLIRALVTLGVFEEDGERIRQTPCSEALRSGDGASVRERAMLLGSDFIWQAIGGLPASVRTGATAFERRFGSSFFEYVSAHPDAHDAFRAGLPQRSSLLARIVDAYDFSPFARIADLGGGQGALVTAILRRHGGIHATLLDLPHVADEARAPLVERWGRRVHVVSGSLFCDVPARCDLYVLSHVLHNWDDDRAAAILARCAEAMRADSRLLVIESAWQPSSEAARMFSDLLMMVLTGGRERDEAELRNLLTANGFAAGPATTLPGALLLEARRR